MALSTEPIDAAAAVQDSWRIEACSPGRSVQRTTESTRFDLDQGGYDGPWPTRWRDSGPGWRSKARAN